MDLFGMDLLKSATIERHGPRVTGTLTADGNVVKMIFASFAGRCDCASFRASLRRIACCMMQASLAAALDRLVKLNRRMKGWPMPNSVRRSPSKPPA